MMKQLCPYLFLIVFGANLHLYAMQSEGAVQSKPSSENIVEKLIEKEKEALVQYKEKEKAILAALLPERRRQLTEQKYVIKESEKVEGKQPLLRNMGEEDLRTAWSHVEDESSNPEHFRWEVAGDLDYFMTLDYLKKAVKERLMRLYKNGQILTQEQFDKLDPKAWYPKDNNLTRLFGAEYLAKRFAGKANWKVPTFIIVVQNLNDLQIRIEWNNCIPHLKTIDNGSIYAENITDWEDYSASGVINEMFIKKELNALGYWDFAGKGNIVKTKAGKLYVLDTEIKSLMENATNDVPILTSRIPWLDSLHCEYLMKRFSFLNGVDTNKALVIHISLL